MKRCRYVALLVLCALPLCALASDDLVRVEVLVFKYSNGQSDAWPVERLEDFSALPDPHRRALLAGWTARYREDLNEAAEAGDDPWSAADPANAESAADQRPQLPEQQGTQTPAVRPLAEDPRGPVWPERFVHEPRLSGPMQRAHDRLASSSGHEILSVTSWLQPLDRRSPSPAVRIRDDTPVSIAWLSPPSAPFAIDRVLTQPDQILESIYRLDGSVRIRQRQFRHADLNLVWSQRQALQPMPPADAVDFEVHRMRLSRPIQLGRLEYFDSAWLGVLILVEPWQPPEP